MNNTHTKTTVRHSPTTTKTTTKTHSTKKKPKPHSTAKNNPTPSITRIATVATNQLAPSPLSLILPTPTSTVLDTENVTLHTEQEVIDMATVSAAAAIASSATIAGGVPTSNHNSTSDHVVRIVGPIIGIFAGVAFLAAAMFTVVRNRKKKMTAAKNKDEEGADDDTFQNVSLDDEGLAGLKYMPSLANQEQQTKETKTASIISTTSTAYHSISSTLVASRSNSVQKKEQKHISWQSTKSHLDTDRFSEVFLSPESTLTGKHVESFMLIAERQQLHHERPNLLNHFSHKVPIETYKAQLASMIDEDEVLTDEPLPFHSMTHLEEFYSQK